MVLDDGEDDDLRGRSYWETCGNGRLKARGYPGSVSATLLTIPSLSRIVGGEAFVTQLPQWRGRIA